MQKIMMPAEETKNFLEVFELFVISQSALAVLMALTAIGSIVLERLSRDNRKMYLAAQIMASAALIVGMFNAFS